MTYEHQEELSRKKIESDNLKKLRGKIYNDSDTFDEYQLSCAAHGVHHKRLFDRFWYYYLCKNYGQTKFNIVVSSVFCLLVSISFITLIIALGLSIGVSGWILVMLLIIFLVPCFSCWFFNAMNSTTKYDYLYDYLP